MPYAASACTGGRLIFPTRPVCGARSQCASTPNPDAGASFIFSDDGTPPLTGGTRTRSCASFFLRISLVTSLVAVPTVEIRGAAKSLLPNHELVMTLPLACHRRDM